MTNDLTDIFYSPLIVGTDPIDVFYPSAQTYENKFINLLGYAATFTITIIPALGCGPY
jgi:hypothetical protein